MATETEKILSIKLDYAQALSGIEEYRKKIDALYVERLKLQQLQKDEKTRTEENAKAIEAINITMKEYNSQIRSVEKELQNEIRQQEENTGSLAQMRAELSNLTKQYDKMSAAERNSAKGKELQAKINAVTTSLKTAEEETQRYYRNVGNYENAINNALGANTKWYQGLQTLSAAFKNGVTPALSQAKTAVANFGKQLLTLLANPIVAMIAAIAAAIMAVTKVIKSNEEQTDRVRVLLAPIEAGLTAILNLCQKFVGVLISVAEGAGRLAAKLGLVNDTMREGIELQREEIRLKKLGRENTIQDAKDNADIAALRKRAARERVTDEKAYLKTMDEIDEKEKARAQRHVDLAKAEWEQAERDSKRAKNSAEAEEKRVQAEAAYYNAKAEYDQRTTRDASRVATAQKKLAAETTKAGKSVEDMQQKIKDAAKATEDAIRSAEDALTKLIENNIERAQKETEIEYKRRVEDLNAKKAELKEKGTLTIEAEKAINQEIEAQAKLRDKALAEIQEQASRESLEREERRLSLLLEATENDLLKQRDLKLQQLDVQEQLDREEIEKSVQNEQERENLLLALQLSYNAQRKEIEDNFENELEEARLARVQQDFEERIVQAGNNELEQLRLQRDMKLALLNESHQLEGESEEEWRARQLELQADYYDAEQDLDQKRYEMKKANAEAIADLVGSLADAFGELGESNKAFAKLSKVLALGEIAVNTGVALAAGIKQAQSVPFPANIAAIATTVATILANIATAVKTVNSAKFATGGYVRGAGTGTSDSIPARLSNGESVMNAQATAMFSPLLSSLNQLGGGVPIVVQSPQQQVGEDLLAAAVAKGMAAAPAPVVSVEEINAVGRRVQVIESIAAV